MAKRTSVAATAMGALALVTLSAGGALAQSSGVLMTDPREIAACLCLNQSVQRAEGTVTAARALYEALKKSVADQDAALNAKRPTVDTNDPSAVEAFRLQMEKRDDDQNHVEQDAYPALQSKIAAYNAKVADYSQRCGGRFMDEPVLKSVQKNLVCTLEP